MGNGIHSRDDKLGRAVEAPGHLPGILQTMSSSDTELSSRLWPIVTSIWKRDPSIFGANPTLEPLIANRYGWLDVSTRRLPRYTSLPPRCGHRVGSRRFFSGWAVHPLPPT